MSVNFENTVLIQFIENCWKYGYFSSEKGSVIWKELIIKKPKFTISESIRDQSLAFSNLIVLPEIKTLKTNFDKKTVFLITKETKHIFSKLYPKFTESFWEVNELIDTNGKVDKELTEPEINKTLRFVFNKKPSTLTICLNNSIFNSLHEKNLQNVLRVAGYNAIRIKQ